MLTERNKYYEDPKKRYHVQLGNKKCEHIKRRKDADGESDVSFPAERDTQQVAGKLVPTSRLCTNGTTPGAVPQHSLCPLDL